MDSATMGRDGTGKPKYPLNQIYFYLTAGCNLRCRHCWIAPKYQSSDRSYPVLGVDIFRSIIEQAKPLGLTAVKLTGGEPLLHPHIHEILELVRDEELRLVVETNGVLCTPELAGKIAVDCYRNGVYIIEMGYRGIGALRVAPPLVSTETQIENALDVIEEAVKKAEKGDL